jgi:hypothetical protein
MTGSKGDGIILLVIVIIGAGGALAKLAGWL